MDITWNLNETPSDRKCFSVITSFVGDERCGFGLVAAGNVSVKFRSGARRAVVTVLNPWAFESCNFSKDSCTKAAFLRLPGYRGIFLLFQVTRVPFLDHDGIVTREKAITAQDKAHCLRNHGS